MTPTTDKPVLSSTTFFFGCAIILLLVGIVLALGNQLEQTAIGFGTCTVDAEIAETQSEKARGLSNRPMLGQNEGMIFPFDQEQPGFWMKDMRFPIDIVWVVNDQVVQIDAAVPADEGQVSYYPAEPIDWVIEVSAGRTAACGVETGTKITGLRS